MWKLRGLRVLMLTAPFVTAAAVWGQVDIAATTRDPDSVFKFNLSTPGARSLAMGGAFLALADDATAAYTNPAGLTNLTLGGSEVAAEIRRFELTNTFVDRGHYSDIPGQGPVVSNRGVDNLSPGVQIGESTSDATGVSFISYAHVLPRGLVVALYRHELANTSTAIETEGTFRDFPFDPSRNQPKRSRNSLKIINYGLSGAIEFKVPTLKSFESTISLGVGVSYYELELDGLTQFFSVDGFSPDSNCFGNQPDVECRLPGRFYGPPDFSPDNLELEDKETGDDDAFGVNLGFLWKLGREQRWSVGGIFREGPEFETDLAFRDCVFKDRSENPLDPLTVLCFDPENPPPEAGIDPISLPAKGTVTIPDVLGLGVAFRTAEGRTKIALDFNRVRYSQRRIDYLGTEIPEDDSGQPPFENSDFRVEDADQLHLGVERIVLVVESLFVGTARFGIWNEPYHELEYVGSPGLVSEELAITRHVLDRPTDDQTHYSVGFGLAIKEGYQIDLAADLSEFSNTFSFSLVKFF